jgi:transcriptional regulator with XRE-family HTH domain
MAIDAARLRWARQRRALTMRDLAEAAGVGTQTIWRLENGATADVRMSTLRKLARALGVEPAELLTEGSRGAEVDEARAGPPDAPLTERPS